MEVKEVGFRPAGHGTKVVVVETPSPRGTGGRGGKQAEDPEGLGKEEILKPPLGRRNRERIFSSLLFGVSVKDGDFGSSRERERSLGGGLVLHF